MYFALAALLLLQADKSTIPLFNALTAKEIKAAREDPDGFVIDRLLAEADHRRVDPLLKEYLQTSYTRWNELLQNSTASELKSLRYKPFFAQLGDTHAKFGRFLVTGTVLQIIDESNLLANVKPINGDDEYVIWAADVDTSGLVDGSDLSAFFLGRLWTMAERRSYTSGLGTKRTVLCVTPAALDMTLVANEIDLFRFDEQKSELRAAIASADEQDKKVEQAKEEAAERAARTRIWRDATGRYSVEAEFASVTNGVVRLKKKNGKTIEVKLDTLSDDDKNWIAKRRKSASR